MRSLAVSLCICALAGCASNKSAEPPIENPNEVEHRASAETDEQAAYAESEYEPAKSERARPDRADRSRADGVDGPSDEAIERNEPVAADNTGVNERDESPSAIMPTDQGESDTDLEVTQKIRKAVMDDDSLSFTAKNVKIITQDGKVTLRGPVKSAQERSSIGAAAKRFAPGNVDNQLEVAN
jgi:osmotically-inducible protein OsmY